MTNKNKTLLKQTLLLVLISILLYFFGFIGSYVETYGGPELLEFYLIFYAYLFFILIVFMPISIIYFLRVRKNINLKRLNIAFKIFCWLFILPLLPFFIFGIYDSFYATWPGAKFFKSVWYSIKFIDMDGIINFLYYTPALILAGLLYWTTKINKKLSL